MSVRKKKKKRNRSTARAQYYPHVRIAYLFFVVIVNCKLLFCLYFFQLVNTDRLPAVRILTALSIPAVLKKSANAKEILWGLEGCVNLVGKSRQLILIY